MLDKKYKYFKLTDVFVFERGRRLIELDQLPGDVAYISSTKFNNGIANYINPPSYMKTYNNVMTVTNSGSVGYLFYHDYDIVASDHVTILFPNKVQKVILNRKIALFLKPVFEKIQYKYNFGREISNRNMENETLLLPIDDDENVDWAFMEDTIDILLPTITFKPIENIGKIPKIKSITEWVDFEVSSIFPRIQIKKYSKIPDSIGNIPFISSTSFSNGITIFCDEEPIPGNCITVSTNGKCFDSFYQENSIVVSSDVEVLYNKNLNRYNGLFICTILKNESYKWSFGRKPKKNAVFNTIIKLPAKDNQPDWEYMENYIKSLPYSSRI